MDTRELENWFKKSQRLLPWRATRDPYAIWISEVMLQQTQVTTVIPYYHRFLATLPTLEALANAKEDLVLSLWSGLGYYSRARNLQKGAKHLVERHAGKFPRDRDTLLDTPGIGPYTAGAILSIAFSLHVPIVDGNVQRVFSRYYAWNKPIETKESLAFFWGKAAEWVNACHDPRHLNQAIMELGATVCTKGTPHCDACPLARKCQAHKRGIQAKLPARKPKREKVDLYWLAIRYRRQTGESEALWLERNAKGDWWEDLWDLPREEFQRPQLLNETVEARLDELGRRARRLGTKRHAVTHHRLHVTGIEVRVPSRGGKAPNTGTRKGQWFPLSEIPSLPLSSLARKVLMLE